MENEKKRDLSDAPEANTARTVRSWLIERGAKGIISTEAVAAIVGVSKRVVKDAERAGKIPAIDKCTYELDSVVKWLMANPRFIAQRNTYWQVTPETAIHVKALLLKNSQTMIRLWHNDVEDLTAEVCYRMMKRHKTSECPEGVVIQRVINDLWREMRSRGRDKETSLDALREKGFQK